MRAGRAEGEWIVYSLSVEVNGETSRQSQQTRANEQIQLANLVLGHNSVGADENAKRARSQ